jgi:hypothetical protein
MGEKDLQGKHVKAGLSEELEFRVRRAMEIAGEEQFKHIIQNPMAVAMTKEFMRLGLPENEAIQSSFRVLAEGHEDSFKLALNRGFEHLKKSEQDLIRRSKEVATPKNRLKLHQPVNRLCAVVNLHLFPTNKNLGSRRSSKA